ncbi:MULTISPECIES: Clp protease N-terminal domain-containing protein [unclassified Streptomyces]|uniref:Clp protease N-terminal domain-containing protein n=1 Tax=unclassified Streptomyces TaxID=2593676 RepID=UPI000DC76A9D|nr:MULTISPECIES: Clp protease N-terminal domain-containing protein [unclassified Streptomyces]AWZ06937.1 peptidase [Streptomyces sp. ICC4]AWZ14299.1 peptidase [Streptomyces sp. ICC1]
MFERFTQDARSAVTGAVTEAERSGAAAVTEEHLLLSLLSTGVLDPLDADRNAIAADLAAARRRGGMSKADEEALAGLGIDLTAIVARIEETHGEGALSAPAARERRGRTRFTPGAKKVLEQSLRIALGRKDRHISTLHLLLSLLSRPGTPAEVLTDHGITYAGAEAALAA